MSLKHRPFAVMGFTVLAGLFLCFTVHHGFAVILTAAGAVLAVTAIFVGRVRRAVYPFFIAGALILSGVLFMNNYMGFRTAERLAERQAEIRAVITDEPVYKNSKYYYPVRVIALNGESVKLNIRLCMPEEIGEPYDTVTMNVCMYELGSGSDSVELYFKSKGMYIGAYAADEENFSFKLEEHTGTPIGLRLINFRHELCRRVLDRLPNKYGGIIIGLLIGDTEFIPSELTNSFYEIGVAPLFAVSGMHLSIWVMGLFAILEQMGIRKRLNSLIAIIFTVCFMAVTGFTASVCRAGIMTVLLFVGNLFYRRSDSINSLGFAALLMCIINPGTAVSVGFLLSFSATLGITAVYPSINNALISKISDTPAFKPIKAILNLIFIGVCAVLGSLPISILFMGYFSLLSVISNVLLSFAAELAMLCGGIGALFFEIGAVGSAFSALAGVFAKFIVWITENLAAARLTTVAASDIFWKLGVVLCLSVLAFSLLAFKGKSFVASVCIGMSAVIIFSSAASHLYYDGRTRLEILDVGYGTCMTVFNGKRKLAVCASDSYFTAESIVNSLNLVSRREADLLLFPVGKYAENGKAVKLLKSYDFDGIVAPENNKVLESLKGGAEVVTGNSVTLKLWDNSEAYYCCESKAAFIYFNLDGVTALVLFNSSNLSNIPENMRTADILITDGFPPDCIELEGFENVIVSSGKVRADAVKEYARSEGIAAATTVDCGSMEINIKNSTYKINAREAV